MSDDWSGDGPPLRERPALNKPLVGVAAVVVLAALGGWYYWHGRQTGSVPPTVQVGAPPPAAAAPEESISHPVPVPSIDTTKVPLPALADSDGAVGDALGAAAGDTPLMHYLRPDNLVRHIVVTIDNLARQKVAVEKRPITPLAGSFLADGDELHATLDADNFHRYEPMVAVIEKIDLQTLVAVYLRFYPLFQSAYQDLGYPSGYFNDRLVQVIDVLLATPQPTGPLELTRPNVMYVFADTLLEARPAGQKLLLRMGPDNAAVVKAKLTELRGLVTAGAPQH